MSQELRLKPADEIAAWLLDKLGPAPSLRSLLGAEGGADTLSEEYHPSAPRAFREEAFSLEELDKGATR